MALYDKVGNYYTVFELQSLDAVHIYESRPVIMVERVCFVTPMIIVTLFRGGVLHTRRWRTCSFYESKASR